MGKSFRLDVRDAPGRVVAGSHAAGSLAADPLAAGLERLVNCPECGLPAEIQDRFSLASTDGAVAHVALGCFGGHFFRMAVERLPADVPPQTGQRARWNA